MQHVKPRTLKPATLTFRMIEAPPAPLGAPRYSVEIPELRMTFPESRQHPFAAAREVYRRLYLGRSTRVTVQYPDGRMIRSTLGKLRELRNHHDPDTGIVAVVRDTRYR